MVKVTVGEMSYEGTAEEIKELFEVLGAEFPSTPEATEDSDEEEFIEGDVQVGDTIKITDKYSAEDRYEDGDIFEVIDKDYDGDAYVHINDGRALVLRREFEIISRKEGSSEEVGEDLPIGTKIRLKFNGRLMTLSERKPKHDGTGFGKAYGLKGKSTWLGEEQFEVVEDSDEVTKPPFKDGDIAVVTGETNCGGIGKGVKVRVIDAELDEDGEFHISLLDGSDFDWAKPEALELVVDEEETTLKNGDKVRLLHGGNEGSAQGFYNGKIYEVVDVNWIVRDGEHRVCIGEVGGTNEGYVDIEQLEKVEETTVEDLLAEAKAKFPIGAKVRITIPEDEETEFYRDGVTNDEVGTVLEVSEYFKGDKVIVSVDFDSRHRDWNGIPSELEVVTEQVPTEEIEEGDIIRREGKLHEVEGVREPGYMCSSEGLTTTDGRWMFIDMVELVAKKSDRKDV